MRRTEEYKFATICHICNALPIWGLVVCGIIWFYARERSRYLIAQAQQAMIFHALFLFILLVYLLIELFSKILGSLIPPIGDMMTFLNKLVVLGVWGTYFLVCLYGAWRCFRGAAFRYPFISDRSEP